MIALTGCGSNLATDCKLSGLLQQQAASVAPAARAAPSCKTLCPAFHHVRFHLLRTCLQLLARSLHFLPVPPPVLFFLSCPWAGNMALADQLPSQRTL